MSKAYVDAHGTVREWFYKHWREDVDAWGSSPEVSGESSPLMKYTRKDNPEEFVGVDDGRKSYNIGHGWNSGLFTPVLDGNAAHWLAVSRITSAPGQTEAYRESNENKHSVFESDEFKATAHKYWKLCMGFVALVIEFGEATQDTIAPKGSRRFIRRGFITLTLYVKDDEFIYKGDPLEPGDSDPEVMHNSSYSFARLADKFSAIMESVKIDVPNIRSRVITGPMSFQFAGRVSDNLLTSVCVIPFHFDQTK